MSQLFPDKRFIVYLLALAAALCAARPLNAAPAGKTATKAQCGTASWHAPMGSGCHTASARRWVNTEMVAAHRTLPLGTKVRVVNLANGREAVVQIIDRGPYRRGRIIDVSRCAARQLGLIESGTARVRVETLPPPDAPRVPGRYVIAFRSGPLLD